ncbi:L-threonylcarbamoyladenylate synthase [Methylopila capsulata]|uniref:Threonylcarbamoyl-AMP synthase n=1 Tax=Methylopila capsulata TaxID=61654 RepID=A0A9W6IUJ3_9HYPH|nr:L-threonylcarbamoyladenylate synthase [Methylopila capsulata]MBM7852260.1 L-threonylcarbamoyladenylate synthase [Methylopila capsulata]GLK56468.1 threonylcarbamoyl-AMP synthase [Methylopila capsulata]
MTTDKEASAEAQSGFRRTARLAPADAATAGALLAAGRLVAFPTETVYGLGADATDAGAVADLYAAKGRPAFNPLISHVPSAPDAMRLGRFDAHARVLAEAFWPGPLTLVVPVTEDCPVSDLARAGLATLALRVPAHPLARAVLAAAGRPIAAPSANRSGRVSPTTAAHVFDDLAGRIDAVLDGGATHVGVESTIVACFGAEVRMLRPGGVSRAELERVLGRPLDGDVADDAARPLAPGRLLSHYAPAAPVRLDATEVRPGEALLAFGPLVPGAESATAVENLSPTGDLREAAANLFAALRRLDAAGPAAIAVAPIPSDGLGEAIRDRLERAAAPR